MAVDISEPVDGAAGVAPTAPVDGRTARSQRTRAQIVEALLTSLQDGDLQPTATRIAERAGTSIRLIYHHFGDLESLFRAAAARQAERIAAEITPVDATLPLPERIDAFVAQRCRMLEWITPVRRAAQLHEPFSAELRAARDALLMIAAGEARRVFAVEVDGHARPDVLAAGLGTVCGWGFWNDLRMSGHEPDEAEAVVHAVVTTLVTAPA